jgi:lysozyme
MQLTRNSTLPKLTEQLKRHEGAVEKYGYHFPYKCPAGKLTIGYGRNIEERGISEDEAEYLLNNDIKLSEGELSKALPWFGNLSPVRQAVLINMHFNIGLARLKGFVKSLAAIERGEYKTAAAEMLDSKWARQVGKRADELAKQMETGQWQD